MATTQCRPTGAALPVTLPAEDIVDIPSEYITGTDARWAAFAYELTEADMKNIFNELRDRAGRTSRGDYDGERLAAECKVYHIEAVRHYSAVEKRGGDRCMGIWETCTDVSERFEVVRVTDEEGREYPGQVARLNEYYKNHEMEILKNL